MNARYQPMTRSPSTDLLDMDEELLNDVCSSLNIRLLVLFGSHATGSPPPGPGSDLDLAVSWAGDQDRRRFWETQRELARVFPRASIDLVFLKDADPLFRWEIFRCGVLLWGDVDDFLELRACAFRGYVDSADLRALEKTLFKKKMALIREALHAAA